MQAQIKKINQEISSAGKERDSLRAQLREAELAQARISKQINANQAEISAHEAELRQLKAEQARLQSAAEAQQERIAQELRTAWKMGRQAQIKLLLNQQNPDTLARNLAYYRYFFRARNEVLEEFRQTLAALADNEKQISTSLAALEENQRTLAEQQAQLTVANEARSAALARVNAELKEKGGTLARLEADQKELEALLEAIRKAIVELDIPEEDAQPFKSAKGKMPWPVPGRAIARFGDSRNQGKMRWQGVTIPASPGTLVKPIHHGRVIYSDWLRGMGLLIIVDHGDGYLSLYAHNQTLLKEVGEWVGTGTPIATVGDSGGRTEPALYFEVRENGKPVNPSLWCRR
ncbi:murein hydrolase activator EnvC family protein [Haliea sp. E17]|uniref:murein hydrolase activator EnvC family protein n=1 Tax=Haliea sp. E17 TaxID=3401576 RepID=UPI003AAE8A87